MSISPLSSLSIYEYYYTLNRKKTSPVDKELEEYGIKPTDNESLNVALLQRAKAQDEAQETEANDTTSYYDRPWADLMSQLNIPFNDNPADDIQDIKRELQDLISGVAEDKELQAEVDELISYVQDLYVDFKNINLTTFNTDSTLTSQLNAIATYNIAAI